MRRIKKANIKFISLCPKGANKIDVLYKSDGTIEFGSLLKASDKFEENGEITAVVYAPEVRDSQGDIASADVIKDAAHEFIKNGASIDINHDGKPLKPEQARVAETFLVQKNDPRFAGWKTTDGQSVDLEGAWAVVLKIDDPELRKKYRSGEWQGVSMGGTAIVEAEKSDPLEWVASLLKKILPSTKPEQEMNENDLKKALEPVTAQLNTLTSSMAELVKALKPVEKTEKTEKVDEDLPIYKGKADDDRALELHARKVALHKARKAVDWADFKSIQKYREAVAAMKAEWAELDAEAGIDTEAEAAEAVAKSTRKAGPGNRAGGEYDAKAEAASIADMINKSRGFAPATK